MKCDKQRESIRGLALLVDAQIAFRRADKEEEAAECQALVRKLSDKFKHDDLAALDGAKKGNENE